MTRRSSSIVMIKRICPVSRMACWPVRCTRLLPLGVHACAEGDSKRETDRDADADVVHHGAERHTEGDPDAESDGDASSGARALAVFAIVLAAVVLPVLVVGVAGVRVVGHRMRSSQALTPALAPRGRGGRNPARPTSYPSAGYRMLTRAAPLLL